VLEVEGSLRLFGGRGRLEEKLRLGAGALGFAFHLATAATPRAALWLARGGKARLEALPLEVLRLQDSGFLKSIGIGTVGELLGLPRDGLARRCGEGVVEALDRALGALPEPREFFAPPARFSARLELPSEVIHAEGVLFGARRLLVQLEGLLAARQSGIREFALRLIHAEGPEAAVRVGLASATRDAERMAQLLRERLGGVKLARPVEALQLDAADFAPLPGASAGLFGDAGARAEDWARLVERLRARLGHEAVHGLAAQPDHRPEHAWRRLEPGEWDPREFVQPGPRPLWLLEPSKVREGEFMPLAGPERIESGWWDGDDAKRDYFVARLPNGALAWLYREDVLGSPCWYLHGLFA
jgi:protein ImuB